MILLSARSPFCDPFLVHDSPVSVAELEVIPAAVAPVEAAVLALGSRGIHVLQVVILEMSA